MRRLYKIFFGVRTSGQAIDGEQYCRLLRENENTHFGSAIYLFMICVGVLLLPKTLIMSPGGGELRGTSLLHDAAVGNHNDTIHLLERRQAVRDRNHGFAFHETSKALLDLSLACGVETAGCFIKQ